MTLTEFLLARISVDETLAHHSKAYDDRHKPVNDVMDLDGWYDPERVLAECEAKRRIVEIHESVGGYSNLTVASCLKCGWVGEYDEEWPCETIKALALLYANHPDYQEEWLS